MPEEQDKSKSTMKPFDPMQYLNELFKSIGMTMPGTKAGSASPLPFSSLMPTSSFSLGNIGESLAELAPYAAEGAALGLGSQGALAGTLAGSPNVQMDLSNVKGLMSPAIMGLMSGLTSKDPGTGILGALTGFGKGFGGMLGPAIGNALGLPQLGPPNPSAISSLLGNLGVGQKTSSTLGNLAMGIAPGVLGYLGGPIAGMAIPGLQTAYDLFSGKNISRDLAQLTLGPLGALTGLPGPISSIINSIAVDPLSRAYQALWSGVIAPMLGITPGTPTTELTPQQIAAITANVTQGRGSLGDISIDPTTGQVSFGAPATGPTGFGGRGTLDFSLSPSQGLMSQIGMPSLSAPGLPGAPQPGSMLQGIPSLTSFDPNAFTTEGIQAARDAARQADISSMATSMDRSFAEFMSNYAQEFNAQYGGVGTPSLEQDAYGGVADTADVSESDLGWEGSFV